MSIAHEVGHHVQNLTGILPKFNQMRQNMTEADANQMSMRVELQADCFAGVWAHYTDQKGILEQGDIEEALNAAQQIGDDTLQKKMQGYVVPESFNHGTSAQRQKWLAAGLKSGKLDPATRSTTRSEVSSRTPRRRSRTVAEVSAGALIEPLRKRHACPRSRRRQTPAFASFAVLQRPPVAMCRRSSCRPIPCGHCSETSHHCWQPNRLTVAPAGRRPEPWRPSGPARAG